MTQAIPLRLLLLATVLFGPLAQAQIDRAALGGVLKDTAGKALPGVRVTVVQDSTGLTRSTLSSSEGLYALAELPVGIYTITLDSPGFQRIILTGVLEIAGQARTLNANLKPAGQTESIVVSAQQLDQTSNALGSNMSPKQVQELPLNGRNWSTLTALVPGAIDTGGSNQRTIRFAGRGLDDNNFTNDGVDATNIVNQAQQPFVRLAVPTDSIQEFRIDTMLFTAEKGSTPGGQIAVVSRTGGNSFHGNVFEFLRNDIFDAREPISILKPPFRLNQYGGAIGGPIRRSRTFFYLTYEGLRQTLGQPLIGFVPTAAARAQIAAQSPALIPVLTAFPTGQVDLSPTVSQFTGEGTQKDHEDAGMLRVDHRFSSRDTAYLRFNYDSADSKMPLANGGTYLLDQVETSSRPVNGAIEYLNIFSNSLLNEAKFGFNRGNVYTQNLPAFSLPYAISISSFTGLASNQFKLGVGNSFSYIDNLTWSLGSHTLKFGAEVRRIQLNQGNTASGIIKYSSFANFAANQVSSATYAAQLPVNGLRKTMVLAYAQDEWKVNPELTLNLGVRYSFFNQFSEVLNRAIPFDFATCGSKGFCGAGAGFGRFNVLNFDPRVSLAFSPARFNNQTIFRAGFGIYHGDGQLDDQNLPINNEVARYSLSSATIPTLSFPVAPFLADTPGIVSPRDMDRLRKDAYVLQWGASIQRELPAESVATISYVGSKGTNLLTTSYLNLLDPTTQVRQYPDFGQVEYRGNINNSSFQALVMSLQRASSHGLLIGAHYMYSHEIDQDAAGGGDAEFPQNPACLSCERSSGDFDVRHSVGVNMVYALPFGAGRSLLSQPGILRSIFGGWQSSIIVTARSGLPVNVTMDRSSSSTGTGYNTNQRPDRVPGVSITPPTGPGIHNWINPAAFSVPAAGGYGNLGRNSVRGPDVWQADLGVGKNISFADRCALQLRAESFNLFNRAQYGLPLADVSSTSSFGTILSTINNGPVGTGTPRQLQFSARFSF